jgi:hypothetical protein
LRGRKWRPCSWPFVGLVPLLNRSSMHGKDRWEPRDCGQLSKQLGSEFGLPIDLSTKAGGLKAICNALNESDVTRAQIAAVLLGIPESPPLAKSAHSKSEMIRFIRDLHWSGLIKADWDPDEHPRWPAGAADSQGGRFAPKGNDIAAPNSSSTEATNSNDAYLQHGTQQGTLDDAVFHPDSDLVELDPASSSPEQLKQNWQQHEDEVNRQVLWLESKGYGAIKVTKNVSFIGRNGIRVTVDYVVSRWLPDGMGGVWLVPDYGADVKTGRGGLRDSQQEVYPKIGSGTWVEPVGMNAAFAGFEPGTWVYFPIVYGDALSTTEH